MSANEGDRRGPGLVGLFGTPKQPDDMANLMARFPRFGRVAWIGIRPAKHAPVTAVTRADALADLGLDGDHYATPRRRGSRRRRQVTLIQAEHLAVLGGLLDETPIAPQRLRRNIVVAGVNLFALKDRQFRIGTAVFEMTGLAHPCSRMEMELGPGGYNAMRGHGGITAAVIESGTVCVGDPVQPLDSKLT